jgi:hypothetical protein
MSQEELVGAFTSGQISRRVFVRQMVLAGLSVTAAVTFAEALAADPASAAHKTLNAPVKKGGDGEGPDPPADSKHHP